MRQRTDRNISLLFIIKVCKWFMLYMPVVKLFYADNNLDDFDLFLLHAIYSAVIFLVEIPSGYLADVWGRKLSIRAGMLMGLAGFAIYSLSYGFWGFLLAEVSLGIGQAFVSGSDTALLYDTLLDRKRSQRYLKLEGQITGAGNVAEALAGIVVTILAFSTVRSFYFLQTGIALIGFMVSLFLVEPAVHQKIEHPGMRSILKIVRETLWKHKKLSRYVIFSSIIGFSSLSMAWFAQIFIYETNVAHRYFGIIWTLLNSMVALGSFLSHRFRMTLGLKSSLVFLLIFMAGGYFVASQIISVYGIAFLLLFYFARGTAHPILKDRINAHTQSQVRATVFSVRSLLIRIMFAVLGPLMGMFTREFSLSYALIIAGGLIAIPGALLLIMIIAAEKDSRRG